ncbi:MAG: 50S ribosomal protein L18 [Chloroflexi bacterium]|nr:50S ribosomal protein L18 [Chloroflexota bacterium]
MIKLGDTRRARQKRHKRVRFKVKGTEARPRLCVFRSLNHIYAQVVDDGQGHTIVSVSTLDSDLKVQLDAKTKMAQAELVGEMVARRAIEKGVERVVFDRGGFLYHGRVKALAEGARKGGLAF